MTKHKQSEIDLSNKLWQQSYRQLGDILRSEIIAMFIAPKNYLNYRVKDRIIKVLSK